MGVKRVGQALRRARGTMSQREAAERWGVPLSTMAALEQGQVRDYQSHTLARFDEALGRSTYDLYLQPDEELATPDLLVEFKRHTEALEQRFQMFVAHAVDDAPGARHDELVDLAAQLSDDDRPFVVWLVRRVVESRR